MFNSLYEKTINLSISPRLTFVLLSGLNGVIVLISLLGLLNLLHLARFVHHFAVDHRLRYHLHDLPGANVRLLCADTGEIKWNEMR